MSQHITQCISSTLSNFLNTSLQLNVRKALKTAPLVFFSTVFSWQFTCLCCHPALFPYILQAWPYMHIIFAGTFYLKFAYTQQWLLVNVKRKETDTSGLFLRWLHMWSCSLPLWMITALGRVEVPDNTLPSSKFCHNRILLSKLLIQKEPCTISYIFPAFW